jgi:hypothetical protein
MNVPGARIARFVRAARSLLFMQLAAAAVALALSVWAVLAVRDLAAERDELRARVAQLETQRPAEVTAPTPQVAGPAASPLDSEVRPPVVLPIPIPVTGTPVEPEVPEATEPVTETSPATGEPGTVTPPEQDCTGANAELPRCRRPGGRWNRGDPVLRRPVQPVRPDAQQPPAQRQPSEREPAPQ